MKKTVEIICPQISDKPVMYRLAEHTVDATAPDIITLELGEADIYKLARIAGIIP